MSKLERTLVVLKPDTIGRSIIGEIINRFERAGLHIAAIKMVKPDKDFLYHHYETIGKLQTRAGEKVITNTLKMMLKLPVVAIVIEGIEVVEYVRKLVGSTEPKSAAPGTIRGDYAHMSYGYADNASIGVYNLVHASWNREEAEQEIKHRFTDAEIFAYEPAHTPFTR